MANKTKGYKDAREVEGMNSVKFYPDAPIFGKNDIDEVPEEHRQRCVLVSWPMGEEPVFTESEVRAILNTFMDHLRDGCSVMSGDVRAVARYHGIVLDPA